MQFGLFDHIDRSDDRPLAQQYDERLELIAAADKAGFYAYHLAEHHATPLNTTPVPGLFLAALARATTTLRFGPMVYLLPLYSPLRLIEEISMLDHLSRGRMEIGVGRGVSPYELNFHKVDAEKSREIFIDAFNCLNEGLTHDRLTYHGEYYTYNDVPIVLRPLQQPHPAYWYGSSNEIGSTWAGEHGMHFASNGPTSKAKINIDAFRAALAKRGSVEIPKSEFSGGVAIGVSRNIVVADTVEEARRIAKPAYEHIHRNQTFLRREAAKRDAMKNIGEGYGAPKSADEFEAAEAEGTAIVGTPDTVIAAIKAQQDALGINYLIGYHMFGTMTLKDAMHSLDLFTKHVMPAFSDVPAGV